LANGWGNTAADTNFIYYLKTFECELLEPLPFKMKKSVLSFDSDKNIIATEAKNRLNWTPLTKKWSVDL